MTICPRHRAEVGTFWRPSRKCAHPLHGNRKGKPERGANLEMSKEIMEKWSVLVPVGAGKVGRNCLRLYAAVLKFYFKFLYAWSMHNHIVRQNIAKEIQTSAIKIGLQWLQSYSTHSKHSKHQTLTFKRPSCRATMPDVTTVLISSSHFQALDGAQALKSSDMTTVIHMLEKTSVTDESPP